jgi:uncharacterized protein YecT (DUF1311 family)
VVLGVKRPRLGKVARVTRAIVSAAVLVVGAASVTSGAATLAPPVINESFTPLPCHHGTTIGLEGCAEGQLLSADRRIDEEVKVLFDVMPTVSEKKELIAAETAWLAYRKADCSAQSAAFQGGTIAPIEYTFCEVSDNESRSTDLHAYFGLLEQGNDDRPKWP